VRHGSTPKADLAGIAQHVVQRGNDRMPCVFGDADRLLYLQALRETSMRYTNDAGHRPALRCHAPVKPTDKAL